jgi:hypothetical protein
VRGASSDRPSRQSRDDLADGSRRRLVSTAARRSRRRPVATAKKAVLETGLLDGPKVLETPRLDGPGDGHEAVFSMASIRPQDGREVALLDGPSRRP